MRSYMELEYRGISLYIGYILTKGESSTYDYPGSKDEIDIVSIEHCGVDMMELLEDQIEVITEKIIDKL